MNAKEAKDTVTREELTSALENVNILLGRNSTYGGSTASGKATYPDALANDLFRHVQINREPTYETGKVYEDAYGEHWMYSASKCWYAFGSTAAHAFSTPKRPLRKLA